MSFVKEIQRLKGLGHNKSEVSRLLKINRETIIKYWDVSPEEIIIEIPTWAKELDWDYIENEIRKRNTPKKILYEESSYIRELPSYQAFCKYIKNNLPERPPEITVKIERTPGASIEVDYSGDGWQILNPSTGEILNVELFVGALSYSGYFYAEFTFTQKLEDFIHAHNGMFQFFGGVANFIIPDNCKTAVTTIGKYDSGINQSYHDLCRHYGIVVDPADPVSPRHKPNVEKTVDIVQRDFYPRIRNKTFTSLNEINRELKGWLLNRLEVPIKGRGNSRKFFFEKEKEFLRPLPVDPYDVFYFKKAKVHPDCHFQHEKNYYSVPYHFVGKEIEIKFNSKLVHAYFNCERIATHNTAKGTYHYSTTTNHYPEKKIVDLNFHLGIVRKEAGKIGEEYRLLIEKVINAHRFPLKNLRKAQGLIALKSKFSNIQLNYGASMALEFNKLNYDNVRRFAKNYRPKKEESKDKSPKRQLELIYLQGATDD